MDALFQSPATTIARVAAHLGITPAAATANVMKSVQAGVLVEVTGRKRDRVFLARDILIVHARRRPHPGAGRRRRQHAAHALTSHGYHRPRRRTRHPAQLRRGPRGARPRRARCVPQDSVRTTAMSLAAMEAIGMTPRHVALLARAIATERHRMQRVADRVTLVWTGSDVPASEMRDTSGVLREFFERARDLLRPIPWHQD